MTPMPLVDTKSLRIRLVLLYEDMEAGKVTNAAGRARAAVAREILDTIKVEVVASRLGVSSFSPVSFGVETKAVGTTQQ